MDLRKYFIAMTSLIFGISLIILSVTPVIRAADGDLGTMYLVPSSATVADGDSFTVQVRANTVGANSALVELNFSSTDITYNGYSTAGSAFDQETGLVVGAGAFENSLFLSGGSADATGDILLLTLTFTANQSTGTTLIDLLNSSCTVAAGSCSTTATEDELISFIPGGVVAQPDTQAPTAPTNLAGTFVGNTQVNLNWSASTDNVAVTQYQITRNGAQIATVPAAQLTYNDMSVVAGSTYKYRVRATDATSNNSEYSNQYEAILIISTEYSDSLPSVPLQVNQGEIAIITGARGDITVSCGIIKGTGTVGAITLSCGKVSPGLSPGILNSGNVNFTGGTYEIELGGTTAGNGDGNYDQLNVTGTVSLGSATTLTVAHWNNYRPSLNNQFVIINNDGVDAVTGTFQGLTQGATITVDGIEYTISYTGGDGNDVVLTATSVPTTPITPNTGVIQIKQYTSLAVATTLIALFALVGSRKLLATKK